MARMKLIRAAELIAAAYNNNNSANIVETLDVGGVQAVFLKNRILVIPGTNERSDWFDFNFDVSSGDSGAAWHAGFLQHAQKVYSFAKPLKPNFIMGHSLGGASAQIVGMSLRKPTITFGAPMVYQGENRLEGEGWVLNICRADDTVCHMPPPQLGFRHLGSRRWLSPPALHPGEDHRIDKYMMLLGDRKVTKNVPLSWPD